MHSPLNAVPGTFFASPPLALAQALIGTILRRRVGEWWLAARIVEAEAYAMDERASHSSLGRTPSREPMFASPGTIYMYWSRGGPSLNISALGSGNAVLCKAGVPHLDKVSPRDALEEMYRLNPTRSGGRRPEHRLCSGQSLLARSLSLEVAEWTGRPFDPDVFFLEDVGLRPSLLQTRRLGIPDGRDDYLPWRFVDRSLARSATRNPLTRRDARDGHTYLSLAPGQAPGHLNGDALTRR